ncbi:GntR family transcriptional regulator [Streptomyces sp. CHA1]|uniref:GntR family transcriptional regulator n=1 Tax=Streptomyces TaxID=1883 RepID=UPI0003C2BE50|nr:MULTISPECIES: GntR family transcriptional regulator [unclassified Streptomyces]QPA01304.1 GntR family transcriptional regulator [Streptomyces violascens]WDV33013.1 GntR family transcriptional regulator [Streptomyces sp. AD16]WSB20353.1 GntR family transcriptional regulator [Streptomyces albidoflavus]ESP97612.1 GntR-family transcriptional regulator [Streptomyces sp. GBA 94-10 4N24]ESQ03620.1 GntR-family transcriptional regulator [Streptomyces sp. PVA_94-07]
MAQATPTAERAYEHVKELILDGTYGSGELLSEGQVAAEMGISRTPVREAFLRLRSDGFLELYPKRGALVVPVSLGEGRDIMQARLLLESYALDSLAARGPEALRRVGDDLAARCGPAATPREARDAGHAYHAALVAAAGNRTVTGLFETLWHQHQRFTAAALIGRQDVAEDTAEHLALARALQNGDAAGAKDLLHRHIGSILRRAGADGDSLALPDRVA